MKRPFMLKALVLLQLLVAGAGMAICVYLVAQTRGSEILKDKDAADTIRGLWIAVGVIGIPSLLEALIALALIRRSCWAWGAGFGLNLVLAAVLIYSAFSERSIDPDDVITAAVPAVLCLLYLARGVRRWFFRPRQAPTAAVTARAA